MPVVAPRPGRTLLVLSVAALAFSLGQTAVVPAVSDIGASLHAHPTDVAWLLSAYLIAAAVSTPVAGRLGDMFGKRRALVVVLGLFVVGSVVSALGTNLWVVVAGRALSGGGGGVFPLCFAIAREELPREKVAGAVGLLSAIGGIGAGIGLPLGGVLVDSGGFRSIFWVSAAFGVVAAVAARLCLEESQERTPGRFDVPGVLLLAVAVSVPLVGVSRAGVWGWSDPRTVGALVLGAVLLAVWLVVELRTAEPLVHVPTLVLPRVLMINVATVLVGFGMFGAFLLIPALAEAPTSTGYGFGVDATRAGLLMAPGSLAMLAAGPLSGLLAQRFGAKVPLALGAGVAAVGLTLLAAFHGSQGQVLGLGLVLFTGVGTAFAAMPNLVIESVPGEQTGQATGVNVLVRSLGSSVGTQVTASVLSASIPAGGRLPTDAGFTHAMLVSAALTAVAAVAALLVPKREPHAHPDLLAEAGSAGPLAEPALAVQG
ncbi:MAG: transporter [Frankiales bacterium]|nr:transporter [Frankiales bacterium]